MKEPLPPPRGPGGVEDGGVNGRRGFREGSFKKMKSRNSAAGFRR